jgi:CubicO group peptidase (beta-lactamase class C family)
VSARLEAGFMSLPALSKTLAVKLLSFAVATGALISLSSLAQAQRARSVKLAASVARLQTDIPALMKEADVSGMAIVLIRSGKIAWRKNFGVKNVNSAQAVDDETVFEAASLSKPVFAYAVLKLVDQGKIKTRRSADRLPPPTLH